jgi:hypothetical protein
MPVIEGNLLKSKMIKAKHLEQVRWTDERKPEDVGNVIGWFYRPGSTVHKMVLFLTFKGDLFKKTVDRIESHWPQIFVD